MNRLLRNITKAGAVLLACAAAIPSVSQAQTAAVVLPVAKGVYRMPYANDTEVWVSNNHLDHSPKNRFDMRGDDDATGPNGEYVVVAAAAGWIEYIEEDNNTFCPKTGYDCSSYSGDAANCCVRTDSSCNSSCRNNYVWIRHANGEWSKYSHMQTNSTSLVGRFKNEYVTAGTPLGYEGDIGFATNPHLHFEVAIPDIVNLSDDDDPLLLPDPDDGILDDNDGYSGVDRQNRIPAFCQLGFLDNSEDYTSVACDNACGSVNYTAAGTVTDNNVYYQQASNVISTAGSGFQVNAGAGAALKADNRITLSPGFVVALTGNFAASIGACDAPGGID